MNSVKKKKNLIVIGGGTLQVPLIETAIGMGLYVIVFDMARTAPGMKIAHKKIIMSTRDIDGCVREAKTLNAFLPLHGVITAGTDASRAVAAIAASLDLTGIRFVDAEAASNKVLMRKRLKKHKLPIPRFFPVWSLREAREALDELTLPAVLKPADNMGARGVIKVSRRAEMREAFFHTKKASPTGEMILEEFMDGPELSLDALAWEGKYRITGIADRIIKHKPFFVEVGHNMPSTLDGVLLKEAQEVMIAGMKALGIHSGAGKGDLKVTKKGIMIGEIAARLSGGFMSSHTYPLHSGVNLLRGAIQIALGETPDALEPSRNLFAIERAIITKPGKLIRIEGIEKMKTISGVHDVYITKKKGDFLKKPTCNLDKIGHIIASGETLELAESAAQSCRDLLSLEIDDASSIDWTDVEKKARLRLGESICYVCKSCDGKTCASGVPGMGGVGNMTTFIDNSRALEELKILPRYIRNNIQVDSSFEFLGRKFELPVLGAPITGADTNLNGALGEYELSKMLLSACRESGSIASLGDGADPEKYKIILQALEETEGFGIVFFKPRSDRNDLIKRFRAAEAARVLAVGIDIDAVSFKTMLLRGETTITRNYAELKELRAATHLPFLLKGVMTAVDAELAIDAGVDAIVVSNHGGRVLDDMPGTARVLPEIVGAVSGRIPIFVDGGVRSGRDAFKMIALGATAVLIGRPLAIAVVGGEEAGVRYLLSRYSEELKKTMNICGTETLKAINSEYIHKAISQKSDIIGR